MQHKRCGLSLIAIILVVVITAALGRARVEDHATAAAPPALCQVVEQIPVTALGDFCGWTNSTPPQWYYCDVTNEKTICSKNIWYSNNDPTHRLPDGYFKGLFVIFFFLP